MKRWLPLVAIVALLAAFLALGLDGYLTLDALNANRAALQRFVAAHQALSALAFAGAYVVLVAISLPGAAMMTTVGGVLFGMWWGAAISAAAATAGATLLFLAARGALAAPLAARAGPFVRRMEAGFRRNAFSYLLFLRLVPLFPFWAVNLVPALVGIELGAFVGATAIGIIPGACAYASLGSGLEMIAARPESAAEAMPEILALRFGLALVALAPLAIRRWRARARLAPPKREGAGQ